MSVSNSAAPLPAPMAEPQPHGRPHGIGLGGNCSRHLERLATGGRSVVRPLVRIWRGLSYGGVVQLAERSA
jgi:hypothetical protein